MLLRGLHGAEQQFQKVCRYLLAEQSEVAPRTSSSCCLQCNAHACSKIWLQFFTFFFQQTGLRCGLSRRDKSAAILPSTVQPMRLDCSIACFFCQVPWSLLKNDLAWDTSSLHFFFSVPHPSRMAPFGLPSCFSWLSTVTNMKCVATTRSPMGPGCSFQIRLQSLFTTLAEPR